MSSRLGTFSRSFGADFLSRSLGFHYGLVYRCAGCCAGEPAADHQREYAVSSADFMDLALTFLRSVLQYVQGAISLVYCLLCDDMLNT